MNGQRPRGEGDFRTGGNGGFCRPLEGGIRFRVGDRDEGADAPDIRYRLDDARISGGDREAVRRNRRPAFQTRQRGSSDISF